jgi:hypothetical protein
MHNEKEAIDEIRGLSRNAQSHLSHVVRNYLQTAVACLETGYTITFIEELRKLEKSWEEMGL